MTYNKPTIEINLAAIVRNYQLLKSKGGKDCAAVVKANAYGLGVERVAPALAQAGCREFFVATLEEAIELRAFLPDATLYVFHGARKGQSTDFLAHTIIPVLNSLEQLEAWNNAGKFALHVDTGMCRLGITLQEAASLPFANHLQLIISHLACANDPNAPKNSEQLKLFKQALQYFPNTRASLANSSGVFLSKDYHFDILRPGCSLYGISPNTSLPNPMENAVTLSAPVLQYRELTQDESVGYGATAIAKAGVIIATVEIGYADGFLRALSNKAFGYAAGMRVPVIGRVSMDMIAIDVSGVPAHLRNESLRITLIGKEQPVDVLAETADTIGYEIFTRLSQRIEKIYI